MFTLLKDAISDGSILAFPKFDRVFLVTCDASSKAIGGVISQVDDNDDKRPIAFASRALKGAEVNYSVLEKEAVAVQFMLDKHRYFLLGYPIEIKSDHKPLHFIFSKANPKDRHARWIESLMEYTIVGFQYIPGKINYVADALSRGVASLNAVTRAQARQSDLESGPEPEICQTPAPGRLPLSQVCEYDVTPRVALPRSDVTDECVSVSGSVTEADWCVRRLIQDQNADPVWGKVKQYLRRETDEFPIEVRLNRERFYLEDNVLYVSCLKRDRSIAYTVVLPSSFVQMALKFCHSHPSAGHLGVKGTLRRVRENFYWINLVKDVNIFVKSCHLCHCFKSHKHITPPARRWPSVREKWERVHIDLVGPLPTSLEGHKYIFVLVDTLTRYTFVRALMDKTALSVAKALKAFIDRFSCPKEIISDNGTEFINHVFKELTDLLHIKHTPILAYRPNANGLVENRNRELISILRYLVVDNPSEWAAMLDTAEFAVNTAFNRSVGDSPYFLVFQQDPRMPYDVFASSQRLPVYNIDCYRTFVCNLARRTFDITQRFLDKAKDNQQSQYNIKFRTNETRFNVGDRVYVKRLQPAQHKFEGRYVGPFRLLQIHNDQLTLESIATKKVTKTHSSMVKVASEANVEPKANLNVRKAYPFHDINDFVLQDKKIMIGHHCSFFVRFRGVPVCVSVFSHLHSFV